MRLFTKAPSIEPGEAADLIAARTAVVVDVREHAEWKAGHIKDATHIPLAKLSNRQDQIPAGKTIITVCRSGHRSALAARTLTRTGHDVVNLRGGMNAWARAGLPLSPSSARNG